MNTLQGTGKLTLSRTTIKNLATRTAIRTGISGNRCYVTECCSKGDPTTGATTFGGVTGEQTTNPSC